MHSNDAASATKYLTARRVACIGALKLYGLVLAALLCDWMSK
ncbi:hypothetical protein DUPY_51370 [Duganella phyllosphaerae]|uniref:Uncharacterized protein n=2 Tax=Duganella phyllosphaerae TaxID=762836 RepID=A0A1E7W6E6_9BURK|nr:hypothetical protein DUPY_51370 [Duganella phyllosphaerae]